MIIQIYEIQEPESAEKCIEIGIDHIGSVLLSEYDWKKLSVKDVMNVVSDSNSKSSIIPCFSNPDTISRAIDFYRPNIIHLCETLMDIEGCIDSKALSIAVSNQYLIKSRFPEFSIMRSIPIPKPGIIEHFKPELIANEFAEISDFFLTDTWLKNEPVTGFIGITGEQSDIDLVCEFVASSKVPVIFAGGLSPENIYNSIIKTNPFGVDSCSLTNKVDNKGKPLRFCKDFEKVMYFKNEVERAVADIAKLLHKAE